MSILYSLLLAAVLTVACAPTTGYCQQHQNDSVEYPPAWLQFVGGSAAYALPFWLGSGNTFFQPSDSGKHALGAFIGFFAAAVVVPAFHEWIGTNNRSFFVFDFVGAALGGLISIPAYNITTNNGNSVFVRYCALSVPPVLFGVLFDLLYRVPWQDDTEGKPTTPKFSLLPSYSNSQLRVGILAHF